MESVKAIMDNEDLAINDLEERANSLIGTLADDRHKEYNTLPYVQTDLKLHLILKAMLAHAEGCGGKAGKRYTVSAICACHEGEYDSEATLAGLQDLATTWLSHPLFVCKHRRSIA